MAVYVLEYLSGMIPDIRKRALKLEAGDSLQIFDFPDNETLNSYFHATRLSFPGYERRELRFEKSPRISLFPEKYILISRKDK